MKERKGRGKVKREGEAKPQGNARRKRQEARLAGTRKGTEGAKEPPLSGTALLAATAAPQLPRLERYRRGEDDTTPAQETPPQQRRVTKPHRG